jgi:hypothetical protein
MTATWKGKPLDDHSIEELMEIIAQLDQELRKRRTYSRAIALGRSEMHRLGESFHE